MKATALVRQQGQQLNAVINTGQGDTAVSGEVASYGFHLWFKSPEQAYKKWICTESYDLKFKRITGLSSKNVGLKYKEKCRPKQGGKSWSCKKRYGGKADFTPCQPSCSGKECGDDGCGGSCGACPGGESCTPVGVCAAR